MSASAASPLSSKLHIDRHITYWLRCLKTFLPSHYSSNDNNRLSLAFFTVSALDLLQNLHERTVAQERADYIAWIYHCQHANGGFRGSPATYLGNRADDRNEKWDPPNLPATYFALLALLILGDSLQGVRRRETLEWLPTLQRQQGGFGEEVIGGRIEGGSDMRFCYCAAGVRWILRGKGGKTTPGGVRDIDVDALVQFINSCESYDHGFADEPYHEAHGGLTYCAIAALALIDRLPEGVRSHKASVEQARSGAKKLRGLPELERTVQWLVARQLHYDAPKDGDSDTPLESEVPHAQNLEVLRQSVSHPHQPTSPITAQQVLTPQKPIYAGFNGRMNKTADTCYSWWVGGSLTILDRYHLSSPLLNRRFLLSITQKDLLGGFGKMAGAPPDPLHAYFGLTSLAISKEEGLRSIDPVLCVSVQTREFLESLAWWNGEKDEHPKIDAIDVRRPSQILYSDA